jgi:hypothetical protein
MSKPKKSKSYICYACRDGKHYLCAFDLDPKRVCNCDLTWHVELTDTHIRRFKGNELQEIERKFA